MVQLQKKLRDGQLPLFYSIKFNFCSSVCVDYEFAVWWAQFRLLAGKELSKLGEDESVVLEIASVLPFLLRLRNWRVEISSGHFVVT